MIDRLAQPVLAMPRPLKRVLALSVDAGLCVLCVWIALSLRYDRCVELAGVHWLAVAGAVMLALPLFV
ncbi:MAG: polysaccharide biosynthesis protein, partial [Variovorax paradoxus]|nr:polysaccharide biosynthesis protein [Variovorax paradoxus]